MGDLYLSDTAFSRYYGQEPDSVSEPRDNSYSEAAISLNKLSKKILLKPSADTEYCWTSSPYMAVLSASVCMTHDTNLELGSQHEYMPARQLEHLAEETGALLRGGAILVDGGAAAVSSGTRHALLTLHWAIDITVKASHVSTPLSGPPYF